LKQPVAPAIVGAGSKRGRGRRRQEGNVPNDGFLSPEEITKLTTMLALGAGDRGINEADLRALIEYAYDARVRSTIVDLILKGLIVPHMVDGDVVVRLATAGELARVHDLSVPKAG
jgi:hypothetical protein